MSGVTWNGVWTKLGSVSEANGIAIFIISTLIRPKIRVRNPLRGTNNPFAGGSRNSRMTFKEMVEGWEKKQSYLSKYAAVWYDTREQM